MKPAIPRPQARADLRAEIVYSRKHPGKPIANQLAGAADDALRHRQQNPGIAPLGPGSFNRGLFR